MDVLLAFPGILLAIALVAVLGPSLRNVVLALVTIGWVGYARLVRGQVLKIRELDYVQAIPCAGRLTRPRVACARDSRDILGRQRSGNTRHGRCIIGEASLSFLGLGVQPPTASWGTMLDAGRSHLFDAPHLTIVPGMAIALLVLGFNFTGDALRDRLDPRL
jgi:peptide/nickel transport system permease protein